MPEHCLSFVRVRSVSLSLELFATLQSAAVFSLNFFVFSTPPLSLLKENFFRYTRLGFEVQCSYT
jgi:hypothetical protein